MSHNPINWFEIPVNNMDRAVLFYESVLGYKLNRQEMGHLVMAWFPMHKEAFGSTGSLIYNPEFYEPADKGTMVYFASPSGDLSNELAKVEAAGGQVVIDKRQISAEHGYMAVVKDTEGNRVALHSMV